MSRHEGVSCDACMKGNFRGDRYKCLICYDYDLCSMCYEAGITSREHSADHPMQCIITRSDYDIYYGGEAVSPDQPQSFTCPFCGRLGFTDTTLFDHVSSEHPTASAEVVCPICASIPGADPNKIPDDFAAHLSVEHRSLKDFDDHINGGRSVRRMPHARGLLAARTPRRGGGLQAVSASSSSGITSATSRDPIDPIAELLSQLSGARSRTSAVQSMTAQLQSLEMQLQSTRQQLDRLPRRQAEVVGGKTATGTTTAGLVLTGGGLQNIVLTNAGTLAGASSGATQPGSTSHPSPAAAVAQESRFLLARHAEPSMNELDRLALDVLRADRSLFAQELLLASLSGDERQEGTGAAIGYSGSTLPASALVASASSLSTSRDSTSIARAPIRAWEASNGEVRATSRNNASSSSSSNEKNKTVAASSSASSLPAHKASSSSQGNRISGSRDGQ